MGISLETFMPSGLGDWLVLGTIASLVGGLFFLRYQTKKLNEENLEQLRSHFEDKGLEPIAVDLLEDIAKNARCEIYEILQSEAEFDRGVAEHLRKVLDQGADPRETAKDIAWLKRELEFPVGNETPTILSRVILKDPRGLGATDGVLVQVGQDQYEVVVGHVYKELYPGSLLEFLYLDGKKMASQSAVVRQVEEHEVFAVVKLAPPDVGGFQKREHFRVHTAIQAKVMIRRDQAAFTPEEVEGDFDAVPGELVNLSGGGGRVRMQCPLEPRDILYLTFSLEPGETPINTEARAVWVKHDESGRWTAGFEFQNMDSETWRRLTMFLFCKQNAQIKQTHQK